MKIDLGSFGSYNVKKRWLTLGIVVVLLVSTYLFLDKGWIFMTKTIETDATVRIEAAGLDLRAYEFTPETAPHMTCIFVAGTQKSGLFCFSKKNQ
ncbi:hypothetical protein LCGC14_1713630 [marine sediment metagenome]|uniref:Uncharacterized protein n=1 Tax=marine sediment metagenome TaxID=412755 RepID=A0A0F9KEH0_9ZZZZ